MLLLSGCSKGSERLPDGPQELWVPVDPKVSAEVPLSARVWLARAEQAAAGGFQVNCCFRLKGPRTSHAHVLQIPLHKLIGGLLKRCHSTCVWRVELMAAHSRDDHRNEEKGA